MKRVLIGVVLLFVLADVRAEELSKEGLENLKKAAQKVADAQKNQDHKAMLESVPPKLIEMLGGKEKFIETLENIAKEFEKQKVKINKVTTADPVSITKGSDGWYAFVPFHLELTVDGKSIKSSSYLLSFSPDDGKTWQMVDTSGVKTLKEAQKMFPNYPEKLAIPKPPKE